MFAGIYYCRVRLVIQRRLALSSSEDAPAPAKRRVSPRDAPRRVLRIRIILVYRTTSPPSVHPSLCLAVSICFGLGRIHGLVRCREFRCAIFRGSGSSSRIGRHRRSCKRVGGRYPDAGDVVSPMLKYEYNRIPCPIPDRGGERRFSEKGISESVDKGEDASGFGSRFVEILNIYAVVRSPVRIR